MVYCFLCCLLSLQLLQELDVLFALRVDLTRLDENAGVEDNFAHVFLHVGCDKHRRWILVLFTALIGIEMSTRDYPVQVSAFVGHLCLEMVLIVSEFALLRQINIVLQQLQFILVTVT